jgi:hypothetical protein
MSNNQNNNDQNPTPKKSEELKPKPKPKPDEIKAPKERKPITYDFSANADDDNVINL